MRPIRKLKRSKQLANIPARPGMTIIEVMLAALILVITIIGTSSSYVLARRFVVSQQYSRAAVQFASQKLEQLKAVDYDSPDLAEGQIEEELSVAGQSYLRQTQVTLTAPPSTEVPKPCKKVTVTVVWSYIAGQNESSLATYIGP